MQHYELRESFVKGIEGWRDCEVFTYRLKLLETNHIDQLDKGSDMRIIDTSAITKEH